MESKLVKNVKNVVVGFFVLVFIMGFFSKSIINLFLPKVITEAALEGMVERTLTVEGTVEAKNTFQVRLSGDAIIEEFLVKVGDRVEPGKPLFRINKAYGLMGNAADIERLKLQKEAQELQIGNLKQDSDQVDIKNILAMEAKLEKSKEELMKQQTLFDAGAISQQELDGYKAELEQQELDIEIAKLRLDEKRKQSLASIKEAEGQIKSLQLQIQELESKQDFYGSVDEEGICYSTVSGVVMNIDQTQMILPRDNVIVEVAEAGDKTAMVYVTEILEDDYDFVRAAGSIQINSEDIRTNEFLKIISATKQNSSGLYQVEAAIENSEDASITLGQKLKGIVKQKYMITGDARKVSKSAVVVYGGYSTGSKGFVYLLEEKEGVLGKEFAAKEVPVEILAVGDNDVIVSGLEKFEKPNVILNLSYKIKDGVKVFLWQ